MLDPDDEVARWAASGAMYLTGRRAGPPLPAPDGLVSRARWLEAILARWLPAPVDVLALLGERAAIADLSRNGTISCGGSARLLRAADGWVAVSLARPDDLAAVPALLETDVTSDVWSTVADAVGQRRSVELVERATLLGVPMSIAGEVHADEALVVTVYGSAAPLESLRGRTIVDLSSLWAGPLCGHLLGLGGARVVKVESTERPDGARHGPAAFFDLLHSGHECVSVDLTTPGGVDRLTQLLQQADVVIEASRPRALAQHGIVAERFFEAGRLRAWVSITGYGRTGPAAMRVAFGDDAAVAGGLVAWEAGWPRFCADAVADPLTGVVTACAVIGALAKGRRVLIDAAMSRVSAVMGGTRSAGARWAGSLAPPRARLPRARPPRSRAAPIGTNNGNGPELG